MSEQKHTPLPWVANTNVANGRPEILGPKGECIALAPYWSYEVQDEQGANFDLLTRAANTHYQLVAALEAAEKFIAAMMGFYGTGLEVANWHMNGDLEPLDGFIDDNSSGNELELIRAALQAAKEQP